MTREELKNAQLVCQKYLGNADISDIQHKDDSILLEFTTGDEESWIEIQLECFQVRLFSMEKYWADPISEGFFVGETHIKFFEEVDEIRKIFNAPDDSSIDIYFPKQCYVVEIEGGITIKIICADASLAFTRRENNV